ncbi:MAG TPA: YbaB/EbfC family nucleoid-associated protein [Dongiaceae bacterium]|nr:YbaB/EbfC family nucleoid-associated protein [Dongiaceae bacterium]
MNRNMMQQFQKMQQDMVKAQEDIQNTTVEGAAAGGVVKITMTADNRVTKIALDKSVVDPDDVETLEDVIVAAFNDARAKAEEFASKRMGSVTGGLKIPGM